MTPNPGKITGYTFKEYWLSSVREIVHSQRSPERPRPLEITLGTISSWVAFLKEYGATEFCFSHQPINRILVWQ